MSLKIVTEQFALTTVGSVPYTQDFTTSKLGGLTPTALMYTITNASSVNSLTAQAWSCMGFSASGYGSRVALGNIEDNTAQQEVNWASTTGLAIWLRDAQYGTNKARASVNALITNGVRLSLVDLNPVASYIVTITFFAGTDLSAHMTEVDPSNTLSGTVSVTGVGFKPDAILAFGSTSEFDRAQNEFGIAQRVTDSSSNQAVICMTWQDGVADGQSRGGCRTDCFALEHGDGTSKARFNLTAWGSDGYTVRTDSVAALSTTRIICLALKFGAYSCKLVRHQCATATGNDDDTTPAFNPQFLLGFHSAEEFVDNWRNGASRVSNFGFVMYDGSDSYSSQVSNEHGVATINANCKVSKDIQLIDHTGAITFQGSSSFITNGWRWNWTTAGASALNIFTLAIQSETSPRIPDLFPAVHMLVG